MKFIGKVITVCVCMLLGYGLVAWGSSFHYSLFGMILCLLGFMLMLCSFLYGLIRFVARMKRQ